eukprot:TRINITY_DN2833_c0_g1_i1.p1 TRINITY_DN2833_c0_g1~~TRINITY_DN2833_c0_g1_i1.p1  ORF type:complete len:168 (-),score=39.21 TRINITY_DN2833_c0_g1_i1:303-806(-)
MLANRGVGHIALTIQCGSEEKWDKYWAEEAERKQLKREAEAREARAETALAEMKRGARRKPRKAYEGFDRFLREMATADQEALGLGLGGQQAEERSRLGSGGSSLSAIGAMALSLDKAAAAGDTAPVALGFRRTASNASLPKSSQLRSVAGSGTLGVSSSCGSLARR